EELWAAEPTKRGAVWDRIRAKVPRRLLQQALVERAAENPSRNLLRAAELQRMLDTPVRPVEGLFLVLPARDLPPASLEGDRAPLVQQALRLRLDAERIAFAVHPNGYAHAERVWEWVRPSVEAADHAREQGQDLLFSTSGPDARRAEQLFIQA